MSESIHLRRDVLLIDRVRAGVLLAAAARLPEDERTEVIERLVTVRPRLAAARERLERYAAVDALRPRGTPSTRRGARAVRRRCAPLPFRPALRTAVQHARFIVARGYAIALRSAKLIERSRALLR